MKRGLKKGLSILLVVMLAVVGFVSVPVVDKGAASYAATQNGFTYTVEDSYYGYGAYVTDYSGGVNITVPAKLGGVDVVSISFFGGEGITTLNVDACFALRELSCDSYELKTLDVSKNVALEHLSCGYNQLKSLDVSKNTALTELFCYGNQLTALDVSKNTALMSLGCGTNQLTTLDLGKNIALQQVSCEENRLTTLDVTKNTALTLLDCRKYNSKSYEWDSSLNPGNQLTTLDVSKNTALTGLFCEGNQLTALDVSKNTKLESLYCSENQLTSLDVSKNIALMELFCKRNQLKTLDVSKNTDLILLDCSNNQLTFLDVSKNMEIQYLDCSNNQLTSLDISKNTKIWKLDCSNNQLTTLDVSKNTELEMWYDEWNNRWNGFDCTHNRISDPVLLQYLINRFREDKVLPQGALVVPISIATAEVSPIADQTYTGGQIKPVVAVMLGGKTLVANTDYTVSYGENTNIGSGTVTIAGMGAYTGSKTVSFNIISNDTGKKSEPVSITMAVISSVSDRQYAGKQIKPTLTVKVGDTALKAGTDYTLTYGANKNIGKGTITLTGTGVYSGTKTVGFNIVPTKPSTSKLAEGKGQMKVTWKTVSSIQKITKYQLRYRVKGTAKWTTKTVSAKNASLTIKKLKKGKQYQFQVRSYKTVSGTKYYSPWSASKTSKKVK